MGLGILERRDRKKIMKTKPKTQRILQEIEEEEYDTIHHYLKVVKKDDNQFGQLILEGVPGFFIRKYTKELKKDKKYKDKPPIESETKFADKSVDIFGKDLKQFA